MVAEQTNGDTQSFYDDEVNLRKLCNFLRSPEGPSVREAIEMDKRVYYLKGKQNLKKKTESIYIDLNCNICVFRLCSLIFICMRDFINDEN